MALNIIFKTVARNSVFKPSIRFTNPVKRNISESNNSFRNMKLDLHLSSPTRPSLCDPPKKKPEKDSDSNCGDDGSGGSVGSGADNKFKKLQERFQRDDGKPVFLKMGIRDQILYRLTMGLALFGLVSIGKFLICDMQ